MILKAFSIRDAKAEAFKPPFFKTTHGEAERDFTELVRDEKTTPGKYPEDFDLYFVGEYDDTTGLMASLQEPQRVIKGIQLTNRQ